MSDYVQTANAVRASDQARRIIPDPPMILQGAAGTPVPNSLFAGETIAAGKLCGRGIDGIVYLSKAVPMTAQTSGTLTTGKRYIITTFVAGDNFTNVGAAANASGTVFEATGTTPTTWSNGSTLNEADPLWKVEGYAENSASKGQPIRVVEEDPSADLGLTSLAIGDTGIVSNNAGAIAKDADKATGWYVSHVFTAWSTTKVNFKIARSDAARA